MFRFSLRDLFWLTLVIALALSWWTDHSIMKRRHHREKNTLIDEKALLEHELTNGFGNPN